MFRWSSRELKDIRKPKDGERIFFINTFNVVDECIFEKGDEMLQKLVDCGNFFFNESDAQFEATKTKYTRLFQRYIDEFGPVLAWNNEFKPKNYAYYDLTTNEIKTSATTTIKLQGVAYSDKQTLMDAVDFIDKDNFKKYLTNIREYDKLLDNIGNDWNLEGDENEEND